MSGGAVARIPAMNRVRPRQRSPGIPVGAGIGKRELPELATEVETAWLSCQTASISTRCEQPRIRLDEPETVLVAAKLVQDIYAGWAVCASVGTGPGMGSSVMQAPPTIPRPLEDQRFQSGFLPAGCPRGRCGRRRPRDF